MRIFSTVIGGKKVPSVEYEFDTREHRSFERFISDATTVAKVLREHGYTALANYVAGAGETFRRNRPRPKRRCFICNTLFTITSPWSRVCSDKCRKEYRRLQCAAYYDDHHDAILAARRKKYHEDKEASK